MYSRRYHRGKKIKTPASGRERIYVVTARIYVELTSTYVRSFDESTKAEKTTEEK